MATEIFLIRHGHAVRINGNYVIAPLTEIGLKQAKTTGEFLKNKLNAIYTSPIKRTMETTGEICASLGLSPKVRDGVQEIRRLELPLLILFEFFTFLKPVKDYIKSHSGKFVWWPIEGRAVAVLLEIVREHPNERIGVVTHSGIISSILAWLEPSKRRKWWRYTVENCSITRIVFDENGAKILAIDEVGHLKEAIETKQPAAPVVEAIKQANS